MKKTIIILASILAIPVLVGFVSVLSSTVSSPTPKTEAEIAAEQSAAQKETDYQKAQAEKLAADLVVWKSSSAGKICGSHTDWAKDDCDAVAAHKMWIGMSIDMLKYQRGLPDHVNVSNYGRGNEYQACWTDYISSCVYYKSDGIINSYN